jgi:hypothetical protein
MAAAGIRNVPIYTFIFNNPEKVKFFIISLLMSPLLGLRPPL